MIQDNANVKLNFEILLKVKFVKNAIILGYNYLFFKNYIISKSCINGNDC